MHHKSIRDSNSADIPGPFDSPIVSSMLPNLRFLSEAAGHAIHFLLLVAPSFLFPNQCPLKTETVFFFGGFTLLAFLESISLKSNQPAVIHDRTALRVSAIACSCMLVLFWLTQFEILCRLAVPQWLRYLGFIATVAGFSLRIAAVRTLGFSFVSDIRITGRIVESGIYRWMRHPSEAGLLLIMSGGPLFVGSVPVSLFAIAFFVPLYFWRTRRENTAISASIDNALLVRPSINCEIICYSTK